ncbi:MAG: 16S rRNA (cytosine(1402)-N(4))-methyltransferase, partial [Chloroflexota bacterium]
MAEAHRPVLYHDIILALHPKSKGRYIDGTPGAGGHAAGIIAARSPDGLWLGLEGDTEAREIAR